MLEVVGWFDCFNFMLFDNCDVWYVLWFDEILGDVILCFEGLVMVVEVWLNGDCIFLS